MSGPAKVHSTDAIEAVRLALVMFVDRVTDALAELSSEMRRVQEWLEHDRPKHWKNQIRLAMDQAHEAQQALHRCLMFPVADERPSCYEERAELKKAKARLEYCQEKTERVRHWQQTMRHELFEYEGRMSQLDEVDRDRRAPSDRRVESDCSQFGGVPRGAGGRSADVV